MSIFGKILEPKLEGNINRIKELDEIGLKPEAIAMKFKEHNISISVNVINVVLNNELDELRKKALPKKVVKDIKEQINGVFIDGGVLV